MGEMGAKDRKDFTVIGDNVNIASRIQGLAPPNEIWISGRMLTELEDLRQFFIEVDSSKLKGKAQAFPIFKFEPEKLQRAKQIILLEENDNYKKELLIKQKKLINR